MVGLALIVPVTTHAKGYPVEVEIPHGLPIGGVIPSDQVRSSDWKARRCMFICALPETALSEVLEKIRVLI